MAQKFRGYFFVAPCIYLVRLFTRWPQHEFATFHQDLSFGKDKNGRQVFYTSFDPDIPKVGDLFSVNLCVSFCLLLLLLGFMVKLQQVEIS